MYNVIALFDWLIKEYHETKSNLALVASIVQNQDFENAIVKLQAHREFELTSAKKYEVESFLIDVIAGRRASPESSSQAPSVHGRRVREEGALEEDEE